MKTAITFIALITLPSFNNPQNDQLKNIDWLTGTWENKTSRGSIYETWGKVNAAEYRVKSYALKNSDTITFENVQVIEKQQKLYYNVSVANQNGGLPVTFASTTVTADQLVFENKEHDFPQVITYKRITADSLVAEISGKKNGQDRKQTFPMKRLK